MTRRTAAATLALLAAALATAWIIWSIEVLIPDSGPGHDDVWLLAGVAQAIIAIIGVLLLLVAVDGAARYALTGRSDRLDLTRRSLSYALPLFLIWYGVAAAAVAN